MSLWLKSSWRLERGMGMDKQIKAKRIAIMDKIHSLSKKCGCSDRERNKECANCKEIKRLGDELLKLSITKKKKTITQNEYPDNLKKSLWWTQDMIDYVVKNAATHTCKEMAKHLGIETKKVRSKCKHLKIKPKLEIGNYQFFDGEKIVARGTLKEIALTLGIDPSAMQYYRRRTSKDSKKKLIKVKG